MGFTERLNDYLLEKMKNHVGHNMVCVNYGTPAVNVSIECEDCCEVIVSADFEPDQTKEERER